jgi:ferredoxin
MKIVVDYERCESNAVCMGIAPEVFEVRDDGFMYVLDETPPETLRAKVLDAVNSCPTQALSVVEQPGKGKAGAAAPGKSSDRGESHGGQGGAAAPEKPEAGHAGGKPSDGHS